jgi:hypothetical protein
MRVLLVLAALIASPTPDVTKLILTPAQVGPGYVLLQRSDGFGVTNTVTMDLCGRSGYPSETLRKARLQVNYLKMNSTLGLSNEVVVYKKGGAAQAMREVIHHATTCPTTPIATDPSLPPLRFTITRLASSKLLRGSLAVRVRVRGTVPVRVKGKVRSKHVDQTSYAVYQRLGDVLTGTYSFGPNTQEQLRFVMHAAQQSAANLLQGKASSGPTA